MQLAAYRHGLAVPDAKCGICYISTTDQTAKIIWIEEEELKKSFDMFMALLDYWYAKTGLER
jgi:hypothetical protein